MLGAVICVAVLSLFDFHDMWRALWVAPVDFFVMIFTFCVTVFWNVELGLEYGIVASVVILLLQISKLDMDSLGQLRIAGEEALLPPTLSKAETHIRPVDKYPAARQHPNVKVRARAWVLGVVAWWVESWGCDTRDLTPPNPHLRMIQQVLRLRANLFFGNVGSFRQARADGFRYMCRPSIQSIRL